MSDPNRRLGMRLAWVVAGMVALTFASVPLYAAFCKATGFGGTTQEAKEAPKQILNRRITVRFNTDVAPGLAWQFRSSEPQMSVRLG
jgi:cytochrome c oxidase assembly protein subunit 11